VNLRNALRLAGVFCLSAARERRARGGRPTGLARRPVANIYYSLALFALASGFVYFSLGKSLEGAVLNLLASQLAVFLPAFTMFMSMVYSLMTEFSQSGEAVSTDIVNWLPIKAGDFVLGSALTTIYFVSPMASILLGAVLGLSLLNGSLDSWALSSTLSVYGCLLGALALEIVRAAMSRVSGAFQGMRGQWAVILRMVLSVSVIVVVSMMFNFSVMMRMVGWFSSSVAAIRFVPVLWPSLVILEYISGNLAGELVYSALSAALLATVYYASVRIRERYWVPAPVSLRLQSVRISRSRGFLGYLGFDSGEAALIRKDLKSLVRRREMATILAIPVMIVLMGVLSTPPEVLFDRSTPIEAKGPFLAQCAMGILMLIYQVALGALGQEGEAFVNLVAAPMKAGRLLRAKAAGVVIISLPALVLYFALFSYLISADVTTIGVVAAVGLTLAVAISTVELAVGTKYATFTSGRRTQFVTYQGYLIGVFLWIVTVGLTVAPLMLHYIGGLLGLPVSLALTEAVSLAIAVVSFRAARGQLEKVYEREY
jgi:hypothetical protein